ncbi:MAG: rhodanese-like domain-containing protein [Porticoccaceae bacterium]
MKQLLLALTLLIFVPVLAADQGNDPLIIDVRTPVDWETGHLVGAELIEWQEIGEKIANLTTHKDEIIYVYCRSGNRSGKAKEILDQLGYSNVLNAGGVAEAQAFIDSSEAAEH